MSKKHKRHTVDKIKFSIGAKLITIISFIVIISLGSIIALVSWLVHQDLRISAEENNLEVNRRSAMEAESTIENVRSQTRVLMQTISAVGRGSAIAKDAIDFFFNENPHIASLFFIIPGREEQVLVNKSFFSARDIDESLAGSFFDKQRAALGRAVRGETLLVNAVPYFSRSCLALFFPWQNVGVGAALFSSETMNNNFGFGVNQSFMINSDGDILVASDYSILHSGMNLAEEEFISNILNSDQRSRQQLIEADLSFMQENAETAKINSSFFVWDIADKAWKGLQRLWGKAVQKATDFFPVLKTGNDADVAPLDRHFIAYTKINIANAIVVTSIEYDKVFEAIATTTRRNIYLTIAVLCISVIFIRFFAKTISSPLKMLAHAAHQIEAGIFDLELRSKGKDEIGVLTASFRKMCSALHIFGRFTNNEIAVKAMRGEIKPGGLPKHATIFFSDIREFTAKSENFTKYFGIEASDKIVAWLNAYFTQMVDCVEKTNGVVDKFIGDAVMAHWGTAYSAGSPRKDAFNCVKAALMMRKALYYLNRAREAGDQGNPPIKIGCGINTGVVTAGQLGSDMRMEYTVIGDPVNLASRIEALTKPLGADILISEDTWRLVGDKFITEEMPSVMVKGKEKPVRIFAVVNFAREPKGPQTLEDVRNLLDLKAPDINKVDINADEKKYKIGAGDEAASSGDIEELGPANGNSVDSIDLDE